MEMAKRMRMRKWVKRIAIFVLMVWIGCLFAMPVLLADAAYAPSLKIRDASCGPRPCSIRVFRGPGGIVLVKVDRSVFSINPQTHRVGGANHTALVPLPIGALYRPEQIGGVTLGDGVKSETNPRLEIRDGKFSFVDNFKGRVSFEILG